MDKRKNMTWVVFAGLLLLSAGCLNQRDNGGKLLDGSDVGKDLEYQRLAEEYKDVSYCEKISDERTNIRYACMAKIARNVSYCDKTEDLNTKDTCIVDVALQTGNGDLCTKIAEEITQDNCYTYLAGGTGDLKLCDQIKSEESKHYCYNEVAVYTKNETICSMIPQGRIIEGNDLRFGFIMYGPNRAIASSSLRDLCYVNAAGYTGNISLCEDINYAGDLMGKLCYHMVAGNTGDIALCEKTVPEDVQECYIDVASKTLNVSVCTKFLTEDPLDICYRGVAVGSNDTSICDMIGDKSGDLYNYCYGEVAYNLDDPSICGRIPDNIYIKNDCIATIGHSRGDKSMCKNVNISALKDWCKSDAIGGPTYS